MNPLVGMRVVEVEPGHVVTDRLTGESMTVQDGEAVMKGFALYVTPGDYAAIKNKVSAHPDDTPPARKAELWSEGNG